MDTQINNFARLQNLPPYVFNVTQQLKNSYLSQGIDVFDFSMGNPDQPAPKGIVNKMVESMSLPGAHRYTESHGISPLRKSLSNWLSRKFGVTIDPDNEVVVTLGSKEGISHLAMAISDSKDKIFVPDPCYPIHKYAFILAGAEVIALDGNNILNDLKKKLELYHPKLVVLNFPSNPTTECVELDFFAEIIELAKKYKFWVLQDLAYADISFDGYQPPSIMQVKDAKNYAVETYTMSKSYNMPGWRVGFVYGNKTLISALKKIKCYFDYGAFAPIQYAACYALDNSETLIQDVCKTYQLRKDSVVSGFKNILNWDVISPKATMFIWAKIPTSHQHLTSVEFANELLVNSHVAVTPGSAFGKNGEQYIRLSLIEDVNRTQSAIIAMHQFII